MFFEFLCGSILFYMREDIIMKRDRGFTLAELLIVVAIITVLVAIAVPIFNNQLEKTRQSADIANIRAAYAAAASEVLSSGNAAVEMTAPMQHSGHFDKLDSAKIGNLDLTGADSETALIEIHKGCSLNVTVDETGRVSISRVLTGGAVTLSGLSDLQKSEATEARELHRDLGLVGLGDHTVSPVREGVVYKVENFTDPYCVLLDGHWYNWNESSGAWNELY